MPEQDELLSAVGVDYTHLRNLLASEQWQKADQETGAVILRIARRVTAGWLREEDIQNFPCLDLQTIDQLWVKHSQGHFGFTVQNRIWESVGQDYAKFSDSIGWRAYYSWQQWRQYSNLIFSLQAPVGHLHPLRRFSRPAGQLLGGVLLYRQNLWTAMPKISDCDPSRASPLGASLPFLRGQPLYRLRQLSQRPRR